MSTPAPKLVVLQAKKSSLGISGKRNFVYPADVKGRFTRARNATFLVLIGVYAALPWIKIHGNPAIFLDIVRRQFFLFGATFNAQDIWLTVFLLTGGAFGLVFATRAPRPRVVRLGVPADRVPRGDLPARRALRRGAAGEAHAAGAGARHLRQDLAQGRRARDLGSSPRWWWRTCF